MFKILGIEAEVEGRIIKYNFPYFADSSTVVIDLGEKSKFGLSKNAEIGQPLKNIYEITSK